MGEKRGKGWGRGGGGGGEGGKVGMKREIAVVKKNLSRVPASSNLPSDQNRGRRRKKKKKKKSWKPRSLDD